MDYNLPATVIHWNYRGFTEFPIQNLQGDEHEVTDIYLKENLISHIPKDIGKLIHLESLYLSGNDIKKIPREISNLRCLKCLDVSGNRLRSIPEDIGEVKNLKFLILDENELSELPLRIAELRSLQYLSVCDNKLKWLPQRPVYNYFHCEIRFWRNTSLKTVPYSLWYHMFRDQQTRSLNIGCLTIPRYSYQNDAQGRKCRLKLVQELREYELDVECPLQYETILQGNLSSPPSLLEISKRVFYKTLHDTANRLSTNKYSLYSDNKIYNCCENNNVTSLGFDFREINIDGDNKDRDLNGNSLETVQNDFTEVYQRRFKNYYVPADIIVEHFNFLPNFIKEDLSKGPVSRCENAGCKVPVFDYAFYEFCTGKIILIDDVEEIILSAVFCSKRCSDIWRRGRTNLISWTLLQK